MSYWQVAEKLEVRGGRSDHTASWSPLHRSQERPRPEAAPARPTPPRGSCRLAAAKVTCEGIGVDGLESLQLIALLLAVICHRDPRCYPWVARIPKQRAVAETAAALAAGRAQAQSPGLEGAQSKARPGLRSYNSASPSAEPSFRVRLIQPGQRGPDLPPVPRLLNFCWDRGGIWSGIH